MVQTHIWNFQDPASSRRANDKMARTVNVGVYAGYYPKVGASTNRIDLTLGSDPVSELVTAEGVKIVETANLSGVVQFVNPSTSGLTRYDLVVCEYQYQPNSTPAIYKVLQGVSAAPGVIPELPVPQNIYQTPICYVRINPITPSGVGPPTVVLMQDDLLPIARGQDVDDPKEMSGLKAIIDPTAPNRDVIYVYAGQFPNIDRTTLIDFRGGYSAGVSALPSAVPLGQRKYWVYGITDAEEIVPIEELTSFTALPTDVESAVPLCLVEFFNPAGTPFITRIRDLRTYITRLGAAGSEDDLWADMLAGTYMDEMVYEPFLDLDLLNTSTLVQRDGAGVTSAAPGVTLSLDQAQTALKIVYDGVTPIVNDVEFVLGDWLLNNSLSAIREFMVLALHDLPGLKFQYSFSSMLNGFSSTKYDLLSNLNATIISSLGNPPSSLYIRVVIPASVFSSGAFEYRLFSIGLLANISSGLAARNVVLDDQRTTIENSVRNMIANAFEFCSYPNATSFAPDPDQNTDFEMTISGAVNDISADVNQFGPDGWQAVWNDGGTFVSDLLTRVPVDPTGYRYALNMFTSDRGVIGMPLEYRVPAHRFRMGDAVSFALDAEASQRENCQIAIRLYTRDGSGQLVVNPGDEYFSAKTEIGFQRLVVSTGTRVVDSSVVFVGFVIYHYQLAATDSEVTVKDPMAAMGDFPVLLKYSPAVNMRDELAHYVTVHRLRQLGFTAEASPVGMMVPMPVKYRELGTLRATRVNLSGEQNSDNVSGLTSEVSDQGSDVGVSGTTVQVGPYRLDSRVLADVRYERV